MPTFLERGLVDGFNLLSVEIERFVAFPQGLVHMLESLGAMTSEVVSSVFQTRFCLFQVAHCCADFGMLFTFPRLHVVSVLRG